MNDEVFMRAALEEARKAQALGFFPVGAVMVRGGEIIARAHKTMSNNMLDHAETNLLRMLTQDDLATGEVKALAEATLYSTLEPCLMCYGTLRHCRVGTLVYALEDTYGGACQIPESALPPRHGMRPYAVRSGVLREEARALFKQFLATTQEPFWRDGGAPDFQALIKAA